MKNISITFEKGNIITAKMLEEMYSLPVSWINYMNSQYSNGVIDGLEFIEEDDTLYISPGIIKYQNKIYLIGNRETIDFSECKESKEYYIGFNMSEKTIKNITERTLHLLVSKEKCNINLGKITYRSLGVSANYKKLEDTRGNKEKYILLSERNDGRYTNISSIELSYFIKELKSKKNLEIIDEIIISKFLDRNKITKEYLEYYVSKKGYDCNNIFNSLLDILSVTPIQSPIVKEEKKVQEYVELGPISSNDDFSYSGGRE